MKKFYYIAIYNLLFLPNFLFAQIVRCGNDGPGSECDFSDFQLLFMTVIREGVNYALLFAVIVFIFAGFKLIMSRGNESKWTEAKAMFSKVLIGLIVVLIAYVAVRQFVSFLGYNGKINLN